MIMIDKAVVERALAEMERHQIFKRFVESIAALREALAKPTTLNGNDIFQDTEGTIPVTAVSQQVGFVAQQLILPSSDGIFLEVPQAQQPVQQCKWPTCQSEKYQQDLEDQIIRELVGEQPVQEPVTWYDGKNFYENPESASMCMAEMTNLHPLYTSPQAAQPLSDKLEQLEAAVKELADTLEDLADYAGAFSVSGVYLVEDKHARALLAQAYKLVLKYDN